MRRDVKALGTAVAAVAITAGYRWLAGWHSPASWIGSCVVVGSWLVFLHWSPVLIGMVRQLLAPLGVEVRRAVGRFEVKAGMRLDALGKRVMCAGLRRLMAAADAAAAEGGGAA